MKTGRLHIRPTCYVATALVRLALLVCCATTTWSRLAAGADAADPAGPEPTEETVLQFESKVRPLLVKHCYQCHGDLQKLEGGLQLTSRASILRGGESGPAAVPGRPEESLLIDAVRQHGLSMPPSGKLPDEEIAHLARWVQAGLYWPETSPEPTTEVTSGLAISDQQRSHWSFQPIRRPAPPNIADGAWPVGPIDRFVLARLETQGLRPNQPAKKQVLLRRVTFDLTGLPPTPDELHDFLADKSFDALGRVIDRLLASPHYGEHWGRHWLDVVRYADTAGDTCDFPVPQTYLYRNYVIDALQDDKPYDDFLREQIAGDILAAEGPAEKYRERMIATGYLAISRRFGSDRDYYNHLLFADTIDTLGRSILGMSLGCARCHDHKFDPISSADYYALYGIFSSSRYSFPGAEHRNRPLDLAPLVPPAQATSLKAAHDLELAKLDAELTRLEQQQTGLKQRLSPPAGSPAEDGGSALFVELEKNKQSIAQIKLQRDEVASHEPYDVAYAVVEGKATNARLQKRGDPLRLGDEIPRRWLELFGAKLLTDGTGSGRRQLAEWLVSPGNPLTARVMANRVWHFHFGKGLVTTTNDFGLRGRRPSHPELLDYLASRLIESGWSIKQLHREILLSRTYQISCEPDGQGIVEDPDNQWLWRFGRQRLSAESIRDAMLAISGQLDRTRGGPHPFPPVQTWNFTQHAPFRAVYETRARSVYLMTQRFQRHPLLAVFDGADPSASTGERLTSVTPAQALFCMNDPFIHEQSSALAARLLATGSDSLSRLRLLYELAYARGPGPADVQRADEFLARYAQQLATEGLSLDQQKQASWAALARVVLASSEFFYVE